MFIVKNVSQSTRKIGDLANLSLEVDEEFDLDVKFSDDEISESTDLIALLNTVVLVKLDSFGGSTVPAGEAFTDVDLPSHVAEGFPHHPHSNLVELAQITDAGGGIVPTVNQLNKLNDIEANATEDQTPTELYQNILSLAQLLSLNVQFLNGLESPHFLDRGNHTATQLAATISDFVSAADARVNVQKGVAGGGLATLDPSGQLSPSQIPSSLASGLFPQGNWNAAANTPDLSALTPTNGHFYIVSVAGSTLLGGVSDWEIGDWAIYFTSSGWEKIDHSDAVSTVNGQAGSVTLDTDDIGQGSANLYFSDSLVSASPAVVANTAKVSAAGPVSTHSDVSSIVPAEGEFLRREGGVWTPYTVPTPTVRGLEREELTSPAVSTTTSAWLSKISTTVSVIAGHRYRFDLDYHWNSNSTSNDMNTRTLLGGIVVDEHNQEPKDSAGSFGATGSNQRHGYGKKFFYTAASTGTVSIEFEFRNSSNSSASVWDLIIEKYRVE